MQDAASPETLTSMAQYHAWSTVIVTLPLLPRQHTSPGAHRALTLRLLRLWPASPYLAAALSALDHRAHTLSRLRLDLSILTASPQARSCTSLQLRAAFCEDGRPGAIHLRNMFEKALESGSTLDVAIACAESTGHYSSPSDQVGVPAWRSDSTPHGERALPAGVLSRAGLHDDPVVWISYMEWLYGQGKVRELKSVFLRAVSVCPWSRGLWLKGLELASSVFHGREASDLLEVMTSRGVVVETHAMEVLLEALDNE